jgi:acetolactate synthase-1/2/3 large subunit
LQHLEPVRGDAAGASRAAATRGAALAELPPGYRDAIGLIHTIRDVLPGAIIVGDSTQPVYAGNLMCEIDTPGAWFNSATGFGALGYAAPAAIGAKLAAPDRPVICLAGDGGLQFTLAEIGAAVDADLPVIFLVWNNHGYREIEHYMVAQGIEPVGVKPSAPDFVKIAEAYGMAAERLARSDELADALSRAAKSGRPTLLELIRD